MSSEIEIWNSNSAISANHMKRSGVKHSLSPEEGMIHLIKGLLGTGILTLPFAFKQSGLWVGFILCLIFGIINLHCMHLLIHSSHYYCKRKNLHTMHYGEVMRSAVELGPNWMQKFAYHSKILINFQVSAANLGFCSVHLIFMAAHVQHVLLKWDIDLSINLLLVFILPFVIFLCFLKHLQYMVPFAIGANLLYFIAFIVTFQYLFRNLPTTAERPFFNSVESLPLFFGSVTFAYDAVTLVLPIENHMKDPLTFIQWNGVLNTAFFLITCLYTTVGFYGYLKFGDDTEDSITLNLPKQYWHFLIVKVALVLAIWVTYAVQFSVPMERVEKWINRKIYRNQRFKQKILKHVVRFFLILVTFSIAELVPHIGLFISFIGSFSGTCRAIIFPPIIDLLRLHSIGEINFWNSAKDLSIAVIGLIAFLSGTYESVKNIIRRFGE